MKSFLKIYKYKFKIYRTNMANNFKNIKFKIKIMKTKK